MSSAAGSYRQLQARLRTNAESVAFYGGIEKEGTLIRRSFNTLVAHQASLLGTQWRFSMWQVLLSHTGYFLPITSVIGLRLLRLYM